jgi:hypothetical protein
MAAPTFAKLGAGKKTVNQVFNSGRGCVGDESVDIV